MSNSVSSSSRPGMGGDTTLSSIQHQVQESWKLHGETLLVRADNILMNNEYMRLLQANTGARPSLVAIGVVSIVFLFLWYRLGGAFVANAIGFSYPLYESYRSLGDGKADASDSQWLTYWVVFGLLHTIESLTDVMINWIPFYHLCKIGFLIWCFVGNPSGASIIYTHLIEPQLVKYEPRIDATLQHMRNASETLKRDGVRIVAQSVIDTVTRPRPSVVDAARSNLSQPTVDSFDDVASVAADANSANSSSARAIRNASISAMPQSASIAGTGGAANSHDDQEQPEGVPSAPPQ